ncbi:MAG: endolytic transglycosylase MltG [Deltaproteobacteria bacterium]|nr:endolytic transglycosylase MltG [Deltaproteobacteria bacterium]
MKIFPFISYKMKPLATLLVFVLLVLLIVCVIYAKSPISDRDLTSTIDIPKGAGFLQIVDILDREGMVKNKFLFSVLALSKGIAGHIKAGEYELATSMTPVEIIEKIVKGDIKAYRVTIPEDFTLKQIAERLAAEKLVEEKIFISVTTDPKFLASLQIEAQSAEGYLYPDTYDFNRAMTTREIVKMMVSKFRKEVTPEMLKRAQELHLSATEFITLASIIGKETGYKEEKTLVSAVFHNRLKKGIPLQSDPTAIYDLKQYSHTVKRRQLDNDSPYNTYKIKGLPPGPIANPGIDSLRAALYPAPVNYLYFVSNNDGTHQFSSTLIAHNQAVLKYQIKRKKE